MPEEEVEEAAAPPPQRRRPLAANLISEIAVALAFIALANIVFLVYMDVTAARENPYIGVLAYMVLPGLLGGAIVLFIAGLLLERRRRRNVAPEDVPPYPDIDLNVPRTRRLVIASIAAIAIFAMVSLLGSYRAYHYTDSDAFCGTTLPRGDETGVHRVQALAPRARRLRRLPRRRGGHLVREVEAFRRLSGLLDGAQQVPAPDPVACRKPATGARDLRAVPLAGEVLRRAAEGLLALRIRRGEHPS